MSLNHVRIFYLQVQVPTGFTCPGPPEKPEGEAKTRASWHRSLHKEQGRGLHWCKEGANPCSQFSSCVCVCVRSSWFLSKQLNHQTVFGTIHSLSMRVWHRQDTETPSLIPFSNAQHPSVHHSHSVFQSLKTNQLIWLGPEGWLKETPEILPSEFRCLSSGWNHVLRHHDIWYIYIYYIYMVMFWRGNCWKFWRLPHPATFQHQKGLRFFFVMFFSLRSSEGPHLIVSVAVSWSKWSILYTLYRYTMR